MPRSAACRHARMAVDWSDDSKDGQCGRKLRWFCVFEVGTYGTPGVLEMARRHDSTQARRSWPTSARFLDVTRAPSP
ncbi:uncharacterized protein MYCGRDRAFT_102369 [Zymoseptoria tritici IPO323]|uniref:Uncharacterized protein n=1 Tax=Zymoseptoria tritici (strain CBS 115943 / IPO323) TaxID=336722 RepID=F9WWI7_ZYMTI|nr:uncharacterized protein MYCGRDRAFT_102369 [Zymoseptoria tritici IPO323]EGP91205.1 hypothetical protein MYCGRDRAFT_102369 [Zymoseptoria tritici IPO323]